MARKRIFVMVSSVTPDTGSGNTGTDDTSSDSGSTALPSSLASIAGNLQQGFNSNHISWDWVNWSLGSYAATRDLDTVNVFNPILPGDATEPDSAVDLLIAIGGTDGSDHLRNRDYIFDSSNSGGERNITGAFMGFSGDDVLYSANLNNPMLLGGSGDDSYIIESSTTTGNFTQIVEYGNDANDSVISYENDWSFALDIDSQHLILVDSTQAEMIVFWDYYVPEAKIENFWFDFDKDGLNEQYSHEEFTAKVQAKDFWLGSVAPEALGISRTTLYDLTTAVAGAVTLSEQIEAYRIADFDIARSIAQVYQAAFDREPDTDGLNYWIDQWETVQLSLGDIADGFYNSDEFSSTYGSLSDSDYVTQLYANVLDRTPDEPGAAHWGNVLDAGLGRSYVLERFSESLENQINTELQLNGLSETSPGSGDWVL